MAGVCFILPASLATLALAWAYVHYGSLPQAQGLLYGAKPVMVAIVAQAIWRLGRMALRELDAVLAGLLCFGGGAGGVPPFAVLLVAGAACGIAGVEGAGSAATMPAVAALPPGLRSGAAAGAAAVGLAPLLLVFLKLGVVVFGSGYVLLAFLQRDLVDRLHWITQAQLLDAVTAGQVTPGPFSRRPRFWATCSTDMRERCGDCCASSRLRFSWRAQWAHWLDAFASRGWRQLSSTASMPRRWH